MSQSPPPQDNATPDKPSWYERIPDPMVLIFLILIFVMVLSWIIPSGTFEREEVNGRQAVVPGTFHTVEAEPLTPLDLFFAIPEGLVAAGSIIFITFIAGGLFRVLSATGALENMVGALVRRLGSRRQNLLIWVMTYVFGLLGAAVGFENNIALVPIAVLVGLAIGGDLLVGVSLAIGGIGIGFATSPINPYTVGVSQSIAGLPLFSGALLRTALCVCTLAVVAHHTARYLKRIQANPKRSMAKGLSTEGMALAKPVSDYHLNAQDYRVLGTFVVGLAIMLFGVFGYGWYIKEIAGIFLAIAIVAGLLAGMKADAMVEHLVKGAAAVTGGALLIGVARAIQVLLEQGQIGDTIISSLAEPMAAFPVMLSSILMTLVHGVINVFIPSGSGQAMATMPIMIPLSDLIGMARQTAILAFQVGDGFTNLISPTSGGTLAMLALAGVPYERWVRYVIPLIAKCFLVSWVFLAIAVMIGWGPA
ncbi:MAG TPA: TIGR00366 family protein [Modicisalibacter sp.]|nr:TIGR00366 family protein [Modicisalibacter sp.]